MKLILLAVLLGLSVSGQPSPRAREPQKAQDHGPATQQETATGPMAIDDGRRGGGAVRRYAVVLSQDPVAKVLQSRHALSAKEGIDARSRVLASQSGVRAEIARRGLREIGSAQTLVNAIFVTARIEDVDSFAAMPGVRYVQEMRPYKMLMNKANDVIRSPGAWSQLGGQGNAGAGVKIAILDSGIDQTHPVFQDNSLPTLDGYPRCSGDECAFTNRKVIAARSFVDLLVYSFPDDTRPDDLTPRDHVGHGTALGMIAAGAPVNSPIGPVSGVAPKAYLGNYKVFGSPGVNDLTFDDVIIAALDAAFQDKMDIASLSLGGPSVWGPNDRGAICGSAAGVACDLQVEAVENAVRGGMTVVVSTGNDGDIGLENPTLNTVTSPGTAPSAITVGASVNAQILRQSVLVENAPANLRRIDGLFGDGPKPKTSLRAPGRDVSMLGDNGKACSAIGNGLLTGAIAIIERGDCSFSAKVNNAQRAGAVGVILKQANANAIFAPADLLSTGIPAVLVGKDNGDALKQFVASNPDAILTLDPAIVSINAPSGEIAAFSSQGPSTGENSIKPELVAVGSDIYVATQNYDPNGVMYDPSRWSRENGTSFSAPMAAGAAALVKQKNPSYTPGQIKSALVNAADPAIDDFNYDGTRVSPAFQSGAGAGQLDADKAVRSNVTAEPATISFGVVTALGISKQVRAINTSGVTLNLRASIVERVSAAGPTIAVTPATATVGAGQVATFTVRLDGTVPSAANWYEGNLLIDGGATTLRVPYSYLVGDNLTFNAFPLRGNGFVAIVNGETDRLTAKFIDKQGVPVVNLPVRYRVVSGGGSLIEATGTTDELGISDARAKAGLALGPQVFSVEGGGKVVEFSGRAIQRPLIQTNGVVNAASGQPGQGLAPGSYISIFGSGLADTTLVYSTTYLPYSLAKVSVGFDLPGRRQSYPGRIHFVSPGQINVQIPWELAGQTGVNMKISIGGFSSGPYSLTLNDYSPAVFEFTDPASGRLFAAALDQNFQVVTSQNPVRRGGVLQLYANGVGPVDNRPPSGEPAAAQPLSACRVQPEVSIGGRAAAVQFCGLAPGFVGLYQINAVVASDTPVGIQSLAIRAGGVDAKSSLVAVQ